MNYFKFLILVIFLITPVSSFAGGGSGTPNPRTMDTDTLDSSGRDQINAVYDLRNRSTYIQVSYEPDPLNRGEELVNADIHVQIFQHDKGCDELNFFDTLTPNDTVIYDLDNLVRNDGSAVPVTLDPDSYGYVVVTAVEFNPLDPDSDRILLGNFRIIDDAGYEYRTNMVNTGESGDSVADANADDFFLNFNNVDGAKYADIYAFGYRDQLSPFGSVENLDEGVSFSTFVFDLDEEPLSCDQDNFACGNVMYYGINDDYPATKGGPVLCEGGSLSNPSGGFVSLEDATQNFPAGSNLLNASSQFYDAFTGYIGITNGDGTGSMDAWILIYDSGDF